MISRLAIVIGQCNMWGYNLKNSAKIVSIISVCFDLATI